MSELFGEAVSRTCASDHDREIFQLAYSVSLLLVRLSIEYDFCNNDLFKRVVENLEKIKCITNEAYNEIVRGTSAVYESERDEKGGERQ